MSNNLYPNVPSAPEPDQLEPTKVYPPLQPVVGAAYAAPNASYPPPPAYSEQAPILAHGPPSTVQTTVVIVDNFPPQSIPMKCYYCNEDIRTKIKAKATCASWLLCSLLCLFGCFCGCCLLPFCTMGTRDILHYCPKCKKYLGVHERVRFGRR